MAGAVQVPLEMVEAVAVLRLSPKANGRLQALIDRNTDGALTADEREEIAALVELSETLAVVRGQALKVLGRRPAREG